jgi:L-alanine-DL-glutamate epimerase-like enolase superfamily enzyme
MKIVSVETKLLNLPYHAVGGLQRVAGQTAPGLNMVLVKLTTDEGVSGWGEAFGHAAAAGVKTIMDTLIGPALIGQDPRDINGLMQRLQRQFHLLGRDGPVLYGFSGVDIALWDIAGKLAGLPLYQLLGGAPRDMLPAYSSFLRCANLDGVIDCCRVAVEQGFSHIKLHEIDTASVKAAREAVGDDVEIMLDVNCAWSTDEAVAMAKALRAFRLYWIEEPIWPPENHLGLAGVRATGAKVAAGENAGCAFRFHDLLRSGAIDVAQPSVTKIGGVSEIRKVLAQAEAMHIPVVPHCGYLGPGYLATLHIVASMPRPPLMERLNMMLEASPFGEATEIFSGHARLPQGPGLGRDPDMDVVNRYDVTR